MTDSFDIAIIGMACRFPDAKNPEEFWQNLISGKESIKTFTRDELITNGYKEEDINNPNFVAAKATLEDYKSFDNHLFGYLKDEVDKMDPQCRLLHECCWHALEDAAYIGQNSDERIGLFAGAASNIPWISGLLKRKLTPSETFDIVNWNLPESIITRTGYRLGLNGPVMAIHTACSTSLVSIHTACQSILSGDCDLALAGGVSLTLPQESGYLYQQGMVRSADGHCRPFDINSNGTVGGSGAGILLLKPLDRAIEDNDYVHAVIKGSAINNDGQRKVGFTAPSVQGQAEVIASAQMLAGVEPEDISYIECHGTATEIGDPIEVSALSKVFGNSNHVCMLGAVKSNIGHLDEAAGVAGVIKTVMSLKNKQLAPTLHYNEPNDKLHIEETPFKVVDRPMAWAVEGNQKRIAGVSSFGIGGTNAHIILAEADEPIVLKKEAETLPNVFLLSGETPESLTNNQYNLADFLQAKQDVRLSDVAYVLQQGRVHHKYRKSIVASSCDDLIKALLKPSSQHTKVSGTEHQIIFLLPGQGAQYTNMALALYDTHTEFRDIVDHCLAIASHHLGESLKEKWFTDGISNELQKTKYAQPAIFIVEYALARCLMELGVQPSSLLGYSFGELVAATIAEVFSLEDAISFVIARGKLMQDLPVGAMLSVPLPVAEVNAICPAGVTVAIDNKDSCVVSGSAANIEEFTAILKKKRILTTPIKSKHAAHSPAMKQINGALQAVIAQFNLSAPKIPLISSVTGLPLTTAQATSTEYWAAQAEHTVCFVKGFEYLIEKHKACIFIEVGVGRDLINLARRYLFQEGSNTESSNTNSSNVLIQLLPEEIKAPDLPYSYWGALGKLWQQGVQIDWHKVRFTDDCRRIPLPGYAFDRHVFWPKETNFLNIFSNAPDAMKAERNVERKGRMSDWFYQHAWKQQPLSTSNVQSSDETTLLLRFRQTSAQTCCMARSLQRYYKKLIKIRVSNEKVFDLDGESQIRSDNQEDFTQFFKLLAENKTSAANVIVDCLDSKLAVDELLSQILNLLKSYRAQVANSTIKNITFLVKDAVVICNEKSIDPSSAAVVAISTVIRQEFPDLSCQAIDVGDMATDCGEIKLLAEIASGRNETVAYRNNRRWCEDFVPYVPLAARNHACLKKEGTYLLIGGAGFIGKTFSNYLAKEYQANLIITSRSRSHLDNSWQQIDEQASSLQLIQADAKDLDAMSELVQNVIKNHGNIDGVFYLAGITGEASLRSIIETDKAYIKAHLEAKQKGITVLEKVLAEVDYDFCVVISSLAPILGGLGFYAYAAASAYLDAFVIQHNQCNQNNWALINWDGWEVAVKSDLNEKIGTSLSHLLITKEEGILLLADVLNYQEKAALIISTADINARIAQWSKPSQLEEQGSDSRHKEYSCRPDLECDFIAARNEIETKLIGIWEAFLRIKPLGVEDDFFDLGGNSLKAITLLSQIHKSCNIDVPLTYFFKHPTVKEIAEFAGVQSETSRYQAIQSVAEQDSYPLSPGQRRIYLQQMFNKGSVAYNETAVFNIVGHLDIPKFSETLRKLIQRHESLRTSIVLVDGEPRQKCHKEPIVELKHIKFNTEGLSSLQVKEQIKRLIKPFNLHKDALIRPILIELKQYEYLFFLDIHHIISDGLSQDIFVRDFLGIYQGVKLAPLNIQYKDYTIWQSEIANSCRVLAQKDFWLEKLKNIPELQLPYDFDREQITDDCGERLYFYLANETTERLVNEFSRDGATNFMIFISTYYLLLANITKQMEFCIGTPILGRPQSELQDVIGMFVNLLPIPFDFDETITFRDLVNSVSDVVISSFDNSHIQFEEIVKAINIKPKKNRMPIFDTVFSYMNIGMSDFEMPNLKLSRYEIEQKSSRFDLAFFVKEINDGYEFSFEYKSALFTSEKIKFFIEQYINLVNDLLNNPNFAIAEYFEHEKVNLDISKDESFLEFNF
ncbi:SDR family NAD(P)-dependent oxidoreductase [Xenorhabdus sp. M]|uniref:SDR family NAD(P)-dependent oxidoreductase n=1 Tax=Xenorhabdus szentirmaii TaxID=290112 RepID=A0AAW3YUK9_9GAMM|nr:SDR family NAD(P)-dependent oxidoreductase [Xenorhabdus sp. M]MBD2800447.1 SDR family NAD(P)-dependent oxidoreductase [Xenorhabdus sp. M]